MDIMVRWYEGTLVDNDHSYAVHYANDEGILY